MQEITDIVQIKHEVLTATAAYAFAGKLFEEYEKIPYDIIKGDPSAVPLLCVSGKGDCPPARTHGYGQAAGGCAVYRCGPFSGGACDPVCLRGLSDQQNHCNPELPELSGQEVRKGLPVRCNQHDPAGGSDRSEQMPQMR